MREEIIALLERLEGEHDIRICHAVESGSRAWGFASPDSDYDIRFLYVRRPARYLAVGEGLESLDLPMEGLLDAGGWDLRKCTRLLAKSNGPLVEWLHSPVIYRSDAAFLSRWQAAARAWFSPAASHGHYRGLAAGMIRGKLFVDGQVRAKDYLYALRSALAAQWVTAGRGIPPVAFAELEPTAPAEVRAALPALLDWKSRTDESARMDRVPVLDAYLTEFLEIQAELPSVETVREEQDRFLRGEIAAAWPRPRLRELTLDRVRQPDLLLLDAVAGSRAYGTALEHSDEDRRGIFCAPGAFLAGLATVEQVSDERGDEVYYELRRLMELLLKNNPNALELLATPEDCIRYRHPVMDLLKPEIFVSKLCAKTFGEYSMGQIRKARGLNKKIVNPQPEQRLPLLAFCHVPHGQGSVPVLEWLAARGISPRDCGVTAVQHAAGMYGIYRSEPGQEPLRGLVSPKDPDALVFSSVPQEAVPLAWMAFNQDAFRAHCKAHREYWEWVAERNPERYANNAVHGRGYDSKNLMHTHRLLDMAGEIAAGKGLLIRRPNREELLRIRAGDFTYEDLVARAEDKLAAMEEAFLHADLPDAPDAAQVEELLIRLRASFDG